MEDPVDGPHLVQAQGPTRFSLTGSPEAADA
jgi:hypothetical protein